MVNGLTWRVVPTDEAEKSWDGWLEGFLDAHVKQSLAWARLKRGSWTPVFTGLFNGPTPMVLGLVMERALPGGLLHVDWANGGPCYRKKRPAGQDYAYLNDWLDGAKGRLAAAGRGLLRVNMEVPMDAQAQLVLREAGFVRPLTPLSTGLSYVVDLTAPMEELRKGLQRNWRNQLRRAEGLALSYAWGCDRGLITRYLPLHKALCSRKGLESLRTTLAELENSAAILGERLTYAIVAADGRDGAGVAFWRFGDKAWLALFAADEFGNKRHLPNALFWRTMEQLKSEGARTLDLTGIDPRKNWGVFNFKRGVGAPPVEFIGEWEWSASDWTRRAFAAALWWRRDQTA